MLKVIEKRCCDLCGSVIAKSQPIYVGEYDEYKTKPYSGSVYVCISFGKKCDPDHPMDLCAECANDLSEKFQQLKVR